LITMSALFEPAANVTWLGTVNTVSASSEINSYVASPASIERETVTTNDV